jgi:hypothetical protein
MIKETYINSENKHAVREFLFNHFEFNKIVGLAGPDINEYVKWCKNKGYSDFEIWENNPVIAMNQLSKVEYPLSYKFGDVINTSIEENVLYDLDYCVSVRYMEDHIKKFKDNFIMTFSTRIGIQETINKFFEFRRERFFITKSVNGPGLINKIFNTSEGKYLFTTYFDTSAMCCFAKIA